jgi:cysteine desulfurase
MTASASSPPASAAHRGVAYFDHAATTPVLPAVIEAMAAELARPGNASSLHASGRRARRVVEESRERIAEALAARPSEVVFTAGGTESDNLAVKGMYWARHAEDERRVRVLASAVEHRAVLDAVRWLGAFAGARVEWVAVDRLGRLDLDDLRRRVVEGPGGPGSVALISAMWANNEVGTLQPIAEVVAVAGEHGIPVHSDAVQAVGHVPVRFDEAAPQGSAASQGLAARQGLAAPQGSAAPQGLAAPQALTLSGHKLGGPVGAGALLVRREQTLVPLQHGGGQEREVRSGTLDVPAIAGLAVAVEAAVADQPAESGRLAALRDALVAGILAVAPDAVLGGEPDPAGRRGGNAHLWVPGCEGDSLLLLDAAGVECSTGSACSAGVPEPSHVLTAMGYDDELGRASLRFTLGRTSTAAEVDRLLEVLPGVLERARAAGITSRRKASA